MFRRSMAQDHGMLFDFGQPQPISMWMKNTYLPLDMLFIRADGTVARIARDTEPLSTRVILSGEPVPAVLERHWYKFCALHRLWTQETALAAAGPALRPVPPPPLHEQP